jgi:hypothetical protein
MVKLSSYSTGCIVVLNVLFLMADYTSVVCVVIVTGAWRLSMHVPAWLGR